MSEERTHGSDTKSVGKERDRRTRRKSFKSRSTSYVVPFRDGIEALRGHYYDCSSSREADRFVTTTKHIVEYVGREYKFGGDIRSTLEHMTMFMIPKPNDPADNYQPVKDSSGCIIMPRDQLDFFDTKLFEREIREYVRRKTVLSTNIQKSYSLVLGQ